MPSNTAAISASVPERLAYSYVRFSTPEQAKGDSRRRQTAAAAAYCATHGLRLADDDAYSDLGVSAYRGANLSEGGALRQFLRAVENGEIPKGATLLVENLDRVSRQSPMKAMNALSGIVEAGVDVVTLIDGKRYTAESINNDTTSLLIAILTFIRANEESKVKATRLRSAWAGKRSKATEGTPLTALGPAWVVLDKGSGTWTVIEDRAALIRSMFADAIAGVGTETIARRLNAAGIAPWGRGREWHRSYVVKILANPSTIGRYQPHRMDVAADGTSRRVPTGEPIEGYFPAIIEPETFHAAQALRHTSGKFSAKGNAVSSLVAGLGRCGLCAGPLVRVMKGTPAKAGQPKLVCRNTLNGTGKCSAPRVHLCEVEEAIWEVVRLPPDDLRSVALNSGSLAEELTTTDSALDEARRSAASIAEAFIASRDSATLRDQLAAAESEAQRLSDRLDELIDRAGDLQVPPERTMQELRALYPDRNERRQEANALLRRLATSVTVHGAAVTVAWKSGAETSAYLWGDA